MREGKIKLVADTLEDFWTLSNLLAAGDFIHATSFRRVVQADKKRADRGEKKKIRIKLRIEGVEFHKSVNRLRLSGKIESGSPEEYISFGSHHTVNLEPGDTIIIEKPWKKFQLDILQKAEKKSPQLIIVCVESGEATLALVKDFGLEYQTIRATIPGKDDPDQIEPALNKFYREVSDTLSRYKFEKCVVCGPGFWKDDLFELLKSTELKDKIILEHTSSSGENGVQEILKQGILHKLVEESKIQRETELVEELLLSITKDGKSAYGIKETEEAASLGAVETLLITDDLLRSGKANDILSTTEKNKGEIVIVSHDGQLEGLGGIAALLRYKIK